MTTNTVTATVAGQTTTQSITVRRPKWDDVYKNYPKLNETTDLDAASVFTMIFGSNYDPKYTNACAARLSASLIRLKIKLNSEILGKVDEFKDKGVILGASTMKDKISKSTFWGAADKKIKVPVTFEKVKKELSGLKGVYIMIPKRPADFGATGHVTLWTGNGVIGNDYANDYAWEILFWELK